MWSVFALIANPLLILLAFTSNLGSGRLVRPAGEPQVHADGADADRVLLIGDGFSISDGVLSHDLGLAGNLARRLSLLSGRGADIDIITTNTLDAGNCIAALLHTDLSRYDAVVLSIGSNDARRLVPLNTWRSQIEGILRYFTNRSGYPAVFVLALDEKRIAASSARLIGQLIRRHARLLNCITRAACDSHSGVTMIADEPFEYRERILTAHQVYESWASQVAPVMLQMLNRNGANDRIATIADESSRQRSLDELLILEAPEARVDRITSSTRSLFGSTGAAVTFIDHERQWVKSSIGMGRFDTKRIGEFCDITIRRTALMVVEDATLDPRFRDHPSVTGVQRIRFYAGYPIESPDGARIGALCIVDSRPRTFSRSEAALLRDLTLQVQSELWALTPGSISSHDRAARLQKRDESD